MKETGILFTAPMVRALPPGPKTMTRRAMRDQTVVRAGADGPELWTGFMGWQPAAAVIADPGLNGNPDARCPYGAPGNRLVVRETFFAWGRWEKRFSATKKRDEWHFVDMTAESGNSYLYAADGVSDTQAFIKRRSDPKPMYWKRPAIFMPRAASRITLEITSVRVERLQAISEADAIAEGIEQMPCAVPDTRLWRNYDPSNGWTPSVAIPQNSYHSLWGAINGAESWAANPWVWVVSFRRLP
ncbi:hypothetical protein LJR074_001939 [Acidovorax sp. LjRoot74]|uniref:hypothetical protein n=1 Tax=Acidovorax sp. LjRoot74 TaxID=3342337 RepID=UPI003ED126B3